MCPGCAGGEGKVGKVVDIRGWDTESGRSVASVTWSNGTTNVYRMGHKGKVDLKYVSDGQGGFYYKDHLPKLGKKDEKLDFKVAAAAVDELQHARVSPPSRRARRAAAPGERRRPLLPAGGQSQVSLGGGHPEADAGGTWRLEPQNG